MGLLGASGYMINGALELIQGRLRADMNMSRIWEE